MRIFLPLALLMTLSGCSSILHELQPHRLWRWNYHEPQGRTDDALFSIDDRLTPVKGSTCPQDSSTPELIDRAQD